MMNAENLLRVADAIEKHEIEDLGFSMCVYFQNASLVKDTSGNHCGTTACIGGWAAALSGVKIDRAECVGPAKEFLGLEELEASYLFGNCPLDTLFNEVTPAQAVRTLRYAAKHGVIDWDAAQQEAAS